MMIWLRKKKKRLLIKTTYPLSSSSSSSHFMQIKFPIIIDVTREFFFVVVSSHLFLVSTFLRDYSNKSALLLHPGKMNDDVIQVKQHILVPGQQ